VHVLLFYCYVSPLTQRRRHTVKKLRPYGVKTDNQFLELDKQKPVRHCQRFQDFLHNSPGILDIPWFTDDAWFHPYVRILAYLERNSHNIRAKKNSNAVHKNVIHMSYTSTPAFSAPRNLYGFKCD